MIRTHSCGGLWIPSSCPSVLKVERMERQGGLASSISIWELGIKLQRGELEIGIEIEEFSRRIEAGGVVELVLVDTTIWLRSLALPWDHRDPADRVIVSTALLRNVPLLTKDTAMHDFKGIECVW